MVLLRSDTDASLRDREAAAPAERRYPSANTAPEIINDKGALGVTPERIASIAIAGEREPLYALILGRARARRGDGWQVTDAMHTPQIWWSDRRRRDPSRYCTERSRAAASSSESQEPQDLVYRTP